MRRVRVEVGVGCSMGTQTIIFIYDTAGLYRIQNWLISNLSWSILYYPIIPSYPLLLYSTVSYSTLFDCVLFYSIRLCPIRLYSTVSYSILFDCVLIYPFLLIFVPVHPILICSFICSYPNECKKFIIFVYIVYWYQYIT